MLGYGRFVCKGSDVVAIVSLVASGDVVVVVIWSVAEVGDWPGWFRAYAGWCLLLSVGFSMVGVYILKSGLFVWGITSGWSICCQVRCSFFFLACGDLGVCGFLLLVCFYWVRWMCCWSRHRRAFRVLELKGYLYCFPRVGELSGGSVCCYFLVLCGIGDVGLISCDLLVVDDNVLVVGGYTFFVCG